MLNDDEKYKALRDTLRSMPRVKAKGDFEARLMARIREAEKQPVHHAAPVVHRPAAVKSWWSNLFRPAFAPALGLTVVLLITVVVYFAYFAKMNDSNPVNQQQFVSSTNQGDLVIYVKNDTNNYSSNYPREYSAANPDETGNRSSDFYYSSPHEMPSDFNSTPDPKTVTGSELKTDRVKEEQKFEIKKPYEKYTAKDTRAQDNKNNERKKTNGKNEKILWPECYPEKDEFPFQYIEHEYRGIMNLNERKCKKNQQIKNTESRSQVK